VRYVAFKDADETAKLDPASVSEDDLKKFYADDMPATLKTNEFSTPERVILDAAILDADTATVEALTADLPPDQTSITDDDLESWYDDHRDRFKKPPAATEPASG